MIQESYPVWPGGEWKTVKLIGRGSFGAVYEIEREVFGHIEKAALKLITIPQSSSDIDELLSDGYDEKSITLRFEGYLKDIVREYSMMADMKGCANIVYCDDVKYIQHDDGMGWDIFIKMELLSALPKTLGKTVSDEQVIKIGADICSALAFCEKRDLLHRDIKPQNIFVATDGTYKLGDFGIAKTAERTTSGTKTGTYKYMAPEVYNNQPYGGKADIYSLGLVMYWLLNERRTPFLPLPPTTPTSSDEDKARARRFKGETLPPPAHGSEELQRIVLKACAYDPKDRYATAEVMLEELKNIQKTDVPVTPVVLPPNSGPDTDLIDDDGSTYGAFGHEHPEQPSKNDAILLQLQAAYIAACELEAHAQTASDFYAAAAAFEQSFLQGYLDSVERAGRCRKWAGQLQGKTDPVLDKQPEKHAGVRKKKRSVIAALAGLAAIAVIALVLWVVFPQITREDPKNRGSSLSAHTAVPDQTQSPTSVSTPMPTSESTAVSTLAQIPDPTPTPTDTLPIQPDWTEWSDQLPAYVTAENYDLEERTLYSSRRLETTSSTKSSKMDGWELYDTATGNGAYGAWSDWSQTEVSKSDTRDVETETRYRYSDRETTTGSSSTMSGWTLENTTYSWSNWGNWSDWSTNAAVRSDSRDVESETRYRYRDKETVSSSVDSIPGWTQYDYVSTWSNYGDWSNWSTDYVEYTDTRQVETKTQYRSRRREYTTSTNDSLNGWGSYYDYSANYSSWSDWSDTEVMSSSVREVETREIEDGKSFYLAHYCTGNISGAKWQVAPSSNTTNSIFNDCCTYHELGWFDSLAKFEYQGVWSGYDEYHYYPNGTKYRCSNDCWSWYVLNTKTYYKTQYRYRDVSRTYYYKRWGDWSSYSDAYIPEESDVQVEIRTLYRYRDRKKNTTYYFYRWKDWSSWSTNAVSGNNDREVQTATFYRYRDRSSVPTYHFTRWKDWSSWSTTAVSQSDTRKVESATFYRYRDRVKETTYYFRRWTDWSDYSENPVEKSDTTEVQTKKQYRYKSRD